MERSKSFLLFLALVKISSCCLDPPSSYRFTGAVCRLTYPAAVVLNEKTTEVIQAAFQHAKYPSVEGERSIGFGTVQYGFHNLEIHNLSIGKSEFELKENEGIGISISNVSAVFKGTINYGYGSWLLSLKQSMDFEVESQIDLTINPKLYCGKGKVAADTSDCYLTFHKLKLLLQGDRESKFFKRKEHILEISLTHFLSLSTARWQEHFNDFRSDCVQTRVAEKDVHRYCDFHSEVVSKVTEELPTISQPKDVVFLSHQQICKEINNVANILADFIQEQAEQFLSAGDISVDISVTSSPTIKSNYIESHHKGLVTFNNVTSNLSTSVFNPSQLTESRMLYFWFSDGLLDPMMGAAHHDGRFIRNISGTELTDLFQTELSSARPELLSKWLSSEGPMLKVRSVSVPRLWTTTEGTSVRAVAGVELVLDSQDVPVLYFETDVTVVVKASYAEKNLILKASPKSISIAKASTSEGATEMADSLKIYLQEAVEKMGIPKVISYLERELTALMDEHGLYLFDIINPEVLPQDGYLIVQLDFGFPQHLLVEFLKRTLD